MEKNHSNPEGQSAAAETASLAFFDRIYVINLNRRPDRWRGICTQLERFGVQHRVTRIQGGDDLPGALGCFDSHLNCLKRAQDDDAKTPLILEDDALFMPGWPSRIDSDIVELPMSWDL